MAAIVAWHRAGDQGPGGQWLELGTRVREEGSGTPEPLPTLSIEQVRRRGREGHMNALAFPDAHSFVCLDLAAVRAFFMGHRDSIVELIARRENRDRDRVARDLEDVAALAKLFEGAYWSYRVDRPSSTAFHQIGLLSSHARPGNPPSGP